MNRFIVSLELKEEENSPKKNEVLLVRVRRSPLEFNHLLLGGGRQVDHSNRYMRLLRCASRRRLGFEDIVTFIRIIRSSQIRAEIVGVRLRVGLHVQNALQVRFDFLRLELRGQMQRRVLIEIARVRIGTALNETAHELVIIGRSTGDVQRRPAILVLALPTDVLVQKVVDQGQITVVARDVQQRTILAVEHVHVAAASHEQLENI